MRLRRRLIFLSYSLSVKVKNKGEEIMELCSSLVSKKGECSKLIFQILVYYYYKLFYTGI